MSRGTTLLAIAAAGAAIAYWMNADRETRQRILTIRDRLTEIAKSGERVIDKLAGTDELAPTPVRSSPARQLEG